MKKNYIQPSLEVTAMQAMSALCESKFGGFNNGGGTPTYNPNQGG